MTKPDPLAWRIFNEAMQALPCQFSRDVGTTQSMLLEAIAVGTAKAMRQEMSFLWRRTGILVAMSTVLGAMLAILAMRFIL